VGRLAPHAAVGDDRVFGSGKGRRKKSVGALQSERGLQPGARSGAQNPEKLKELEQLFDSEARRNNVYPLVPYPVLQPAPNDGAKSFVYHAGIERISAASPRRTWWDARTGLPRTWSSGRRSRRRDPGPGRDLWRLYALFVKDGRVGYQVNASGNRAGALRVYRSPASRKVGDRAGLYAGQNAGIGTGLSWGAPAAPGVARLSINGKPAGRLRSPGSAGTVCTLKLWMSARIWVRR
jgi:hypothetical protein